ncbi:uncharacterized protein PV09_04149 [Verruconis gallopava]|uniref:Glucuronyl hydrolase n=1 Tax=Verruconis gallopava TaxID=253628 RepID=A0A0D2B0Z1_9PEZI|nr:uncharacterized protein PV09_04149 [Verruconis gallopava]KIW04989.1 hypothetical protein PV09_04149 [Verruconis gallopava]
MVKRGRSKVVDDAELLPHDTKREKRSDSKVGILNLKAASPEQAELSTIPVLYSQAVHLKIWAIANKALLYTSPPSLFPEYTEPGGSGYVYRDAAFWTSGFFPGSLYLLLERMRKHSHILRQACEANTSLPHVLSVEFACRWWTENLHTNATLLGTHDLGFLVMPWARPAVEMLNDARSLQTIVTAARTLAARFDARVGCLRSWDVCETKVYSFSDTSKDFLVIIDNMMNLDLLFYAASKTNDVTLYETARSHALKSQQAHVRSDFSTTHVINFDPTTGKIKQRLTNQGMAHESCWSRGQAWAIAGFVETFLWTREETFLDTARGCADYFLRRLPASKIPPWDFDASAQSCQPPDTSAAMIAAYGMLLIHKALVSRGERQSPYLVYALQIAEAVCKEHMNQPASGKKVYEEVKTVEKDIGVKEVRLEVSIGSGDTILNGATINNFEHAPRRWANHGLVYADYYFMLFGNKLLELGFLP